jgi:methylated-DNA-protein-cysteine methyltransferase-like protein
MSEFADRVYHVVRRVPRGRVISYGGVAALLGVPRAARAVGSALCALSDKHRVPWWRVINRNGEISIRCVVHGPQVQRALLEGEGVRFDRNGRVDWRRFGWKPEAVTDPGDDLALADDEAKRSVSVVIHEPGATGRILLVKRPADDADLARAWGLPAASLRPGEAWEAAAKRAAREKLGVVIRLRALRNEGRADRPTGALRMRLYDATLARGTPDADAAPPGVTRYTDWRWDEEAALRPAARRGSLCCRLALESNARQRLSRDPRTPTRSARAAGTPR